MLRECSLKNQLKIHKSRLLDAGNWSVHMKQHFYYVTINMFIHIFLYFRCKSSSFDERLKPRHCCKAPRIAYVISATFQFYFYLFDLGCTFPRRTGAKTHEWIHVKWLMGTRDHTMCENYESRDHARVDKVVKLDERVEGEKGALLLLVCWELNFVSFSRIWTPK